jgi:secreted trypsin-like serine protease
VLGGADTLDKGGTLYLADRVVINEKYDDGTQDFDVALLHLTKPFAGRTISLLTAADAQRLAPEGTMAIAAGWGLTAEGGDVSNILRHVTVQIVSNKDCNGLASYSGSITDEMVCAGFPEGGKDSCQGDSGGPLIIPDQAGGYVQAGIVSFGEGCGQPNKFGVYTRVSTVQAWVAGKIGTTPVVAASPTPAASPSVSASPSAATSPATPASPSASKTRKGMPGSNSRASVSSSKPVKTAKSKSSKPQSAKSKSAESKSAKSKVAKPKAAASKAFARVPSAPKQKIPRNRATSHPKGSSSAAVMPSVAGTDAFATPDRMSLMDK